MKKILVADYDGTFSHTSKEGNEILINRQITENFIDNGNIFSFATGRNYNSIKSETNKHDLQYHYLICNNGTSIFNSKDEVIHHNVISFSAVIKTINYLNRKKIIRDVKYKDIFGKETSVFTEVAEIVCVVAIPNLETLNEVKHELSFLQTIYFTIGNSQLHTVTGKEENDNTQYLIVKEHSDKKVAVRFISNKERIPSRNIYTIGNDFNDYGMLECYNGYKMSDSREDLDNLDIPTIGSVHELIKRIER